MAMVCSVNGNQHRQLKRKALTLAFLDLLLITSTIIFVITQMISITMTFAPIPVENALQSDLNNASVTAELPLELNDDDNSLHGEMDSLDIESKEDKEEVKSEGKGAIIPLVDVTPCTSASGNGCDDEFNYRTVVGARISLSIQLIIYLAQLGFGVLLFIAAYHNDSRNLHLWVLFSEVIVVVICLNLFINFFGKFLWSSAIITALYIVFKIFLIRTIRKFIQVNDLELTQFGSVGEFD